MHTNNKGPEQSSGDNINASMGDNTQNANIGKGNNQYIVTSHNQSGGITAGQVNIGSQQRKISQQAANILVSELRKSSSEKYMIECIYGDSETFRLASVIDNILQLAGWENEHETVVHSALAGPPSAITVIMPTNKPNLEFLFRWMSAAELKPKRFKDQNLDKIRIIVGTNPD